MTDLRKAAEMALEFVDWLCGDDHSVKPKNKALDVREALRQALAQPEQEPVAWMCEGDEWGVWNPVVFLGNDLSTHKDCSGYRNWQPLYTAPPKREWVGLTDDEIALICGECAASAHKTDDISYARAIEAKLKEKNA